MSTFEELKNMHNEIIQDIQKIELDIETKKNALIWHQKHLQIKLDILESVKKNILDRTQK